MSLPPHLPEPAHNSEGSDDDEYDATYDPVNDDWETTEDEDMEGEEVEFDEDEEPDDEDDDDDEEGYGFLEGMSQDQIEDVVRALMGPYGANIIRLERGRGGDRDDDEEDGENMETDQSERSDRNQPEEEKVQSKLHDESVVDVLRGREMGRKRQKIGVGSNDIAKRYIPNTSTTLAATYRSKAYSGQFSEDGKFFYSCTQDFEVHLYDSSDTAAFRPKTILRCGSGIWTITDCSLSSDNRHLVYSSITPIVYLAKISDELQEEEHVPLSFTTGRGRGYDDGPGIWSLRFSGDGREIVAGANDCCLYVYDVEMKRVLHRIAGHRDDVNAVCYADPQSSHILYSGSDDDTVKVWDRRSLGSRARPAGVFVGHTEGITYVASKGDGRFALSNGKDQKMKLWDIRRMLSAHEYESDHTLAPSYRGTHFDYRVDHYPRNPRSIRTQHPRDVSVQTYIGHSVLRTLIRCHFAPGVASGQSYVYTGSADGVSRVYSLDGELVRTLDTREALKARVLRRGGEGEEEEEEDGGFDAIWRRATANRFRQRPLRSVTRDVSWHPYEPLIVSISGSQL
ncbi:hypothetical protein HDV00_005824 [Rhizophlyctis rosea]|nr:hypothetical protein HDV00_005824 [Rhizophlyctis rosea]